jgi:hypothetical protein
VDYIASPLNFMLYGAFPRGRRALAQGGAGLSVMRLPQRKGANTISLREILADMGL